MIRRAAIAAAAANDHGQREVHSVRAEPSEADLSWTELLRALVDRDLRREKRVIAGDHKGLRACARRVFSAARQRCRAHWLRRALAQRAADGSDIAFEPSRALRSLALAGAAAADVAMAAATASGITPTAITATSTRGS